MDLITAGRSYVIRNRRSGHVLNVAGNGTNPSAALDMWSLRTDGYRNSQVWHLFPLDQGVCLLVNKHSGQVVNVVANSAVPSARLEQYPLQTDQDAMQTWMVRAAPGGGYHLVNKRSGLYMNLAGNSTADGARVEQYYYQSDPAAAQVWDLEIEDEYKQVLDLGHVGRDPADIGDVVRLTGFAKPGRGQTEPVLIGQVALPFVMVDDPVMPRERQALDSPYYLLTRHGYWRLVYHFEHGGASEYTRTQEIQVGLTTTNEREVRTTVGVSVTAEASFGYGGFTGSLSATISAELAVTVSHSTTEETRRTDTVSRTYPAGTRVAETIWFKEDRYELFRLDGTKVTEWVVRDPDTCITDAYPTDAPPEPEVPPRARLVARHSGLAVDIEGASTDNGAPAVQWSPGDGDNQKFRLEPAGDGYYTIVAKHSGKALDVESASTDDGAGVLQWDVSGDDNQRFRLEPAGDGYHRIIAGHSGKVLAVEGASRDAGTRVLQWRSGGGDNERWRLQAISDTEW